MSEKQFSELTKGIKEAPKPVEKPKPLVEKKDEPKPITAADIVAKLTPKKEIKATAEKPPEPKSDPIAEKIKKEQQEEKKQEAKAEPKPLPPKRPEPKPQPKFNPDKIAALLDKRAPQREAITGAGAQSDADAGNGAGQCQQAIAIGDRCAARPSDGAVESAGRHPEPGRLMSCASASRSAATGA